MRAADGTFMLCRMPRVILPPELELQLNESESGVINETQAYGVESYGVAVYSLTGELTTYQCKTEAILSRKCRSCHNAAQYVITEYKAIKQ